MRRGFLEDGGCEGVNCLFGRIGQGYETVAPSSAQLATEVQFLLFSASSSASLFFFCWWGTERRGRVGDGVAASLVFGPGKDQSVCVVCVRLAMCNDTLTEVVVPWLKAFDSRGLRVVECMIDDPRAGQCHPPVTVRQQPVRPPVGSARDCRCPFLHTLRR